MTADAVRAELRAHREFEALTADLLTTFVSLPSGKVDDAIESAQRRVCELLGFEISALWQWAEGTRRFLRMTHYHRLPDGPPVPDLFDADETFPWCRDEALAGRTFAYRSLDELPPGAARDRATLTHFGVRSGLNLPLSTGGGPVLGVISFNTVSAERGWPEEVVRRLRFVAQIFAGAIGRKVADEALRESEERLQLAAESAGVGLWRLDLETSSLWLTEQARQYFGISGSDPVSLGHILEAVVPEDRPRILEAIREVAESGNEGSVEYRLLSPDGAERWLASRGRAQKGPSGRAESVMGVTVDVTERKRAESELHDLSRRLILAHEEQRALLARELHDDLTQRIAALAIDAGLAERSAPGGARKDALRGIREGLAALSEDVHSLSYRLHPSVLDDLGLAEAIEAECERFRRQGPGDVAVDLCPVPAALSPDAALGLFRVVQEALRNVARHAKATSAAVTLEHRSGGLALMVRDDGVGFDPAAARMPRSLGLASMRERVHLLGGTLGIESAPGRGTSIAAWVPVGGGPP
ncbi:MAG TPA: PAS domain-containing protein [Thermoanaerobaculia bacterium]|nr:PAS domain-containing protein [Thermoanaerobaculia bacterium]